MLKDPQRLPQSLLVVLLVLVVGLGMTLMTLAVFTLLGKTKIYAITTVNGVFVFTTDMTKSLQSVGFSPLKSQLEVSNSFFFRIKGKIFSVLLATVPNLSQTVTKIQ